MLLSLFAGSIITLNKGDYSLGLSRSAKIFRTNDDCATVIESEQPVK